MKAIPAIMEKRKLLSEIHATRNNAVGCLNDDYKEGYNREVAKLQSLTKKLEMVP